MNTKINSKGFGLYSVKNIFYGLLIFGLIFGLSGNVGAVVLPGNVDNLSPGGYVPASSSEIQVFGFGATSVTSDNLTSININFSGTGFDAGDIKTLSTNSSISGVGIYRDNGSIDDSFDLNDTPLTMSTCVWNVNQIKITLSETVPNNTLLSGNYQWIIVINNMIQN